MAEGFFSELLALLRAGLNMTPPEGVSVPGRELLPMSDCDLIKFPPRKWVGRHRRSESMVPADVATVPVESRSSLPLWPGGAR